MRSAMRWCRATSQPAKSRMTLCGGGSLFHRSVDLSPTIVYTPLGVENINQPDIAYAPESPYQQAGPATLADFNHQAAGIVQDRMHLPGGVALLAGGRYVQVSDFNYTKPRSLWLPQYAATYAPIKDLTLVWQLRRAAFAGTAGAVVGRQCEPVSGLHS